MSATAATICLVLGAKTVDLGIARFTLAWTHSVEKTDWQEDYVLRDNRLVLVEARIEGTGAGMEPPSGALLRDSLWHYVPDLPPLEELRLTLSSFTADYRLCWAGACHGLGALLGAAPAAAVVSVRPCQPESTTK